MVQKKRLNKWSKYKKQICNSQLAGENTFNCADENTFNNGSGENTFNITSGGDNTFNNKGGNISIPIPGPKPHIPLEDLDP